MLHYEIVNSDELMYNYHFTVVVEVDLVLNTPHSFVQFVVGPHKRYTI